MRSGSVVWTSMLLLSLTAEPALTQQATSPRGEQQRPKEAPLAPLVGEVVSVDDKASTFAIKTATEGEVKFSYTDKTVIEGADKGAQGLIATGSEVTVTYDAHGTAKVATRVTVRSKK